MTKFSKMADKAYFKAMKMVNKVLFDERGETNIIAIILILAIVIALAFVFKGALTNLFNKIWNKLFADVDAVI